MERMRFWVKNIATKINHNEVFMIMIALAISNMLRGVSGEMTKVKRLKNNKVAFGFNTFVKKPMRMADRVEMSDFWACSPISIFEDLLRNDLMPM